MVYTPLTGVLYRTITGVVKGDTRSLDYGPSGFRIRVQLIPDCSQHRPG